MGAVCSSCCNPKSRHDSFRRGRKPMDKPLAEFSPVFPADGLHISLAKRDSSGSCPYSLIHHVGGTGVGVAGGGIGGGGGVGNNLAASQAGRLTPSSFSVGAEPLSTTASFMFKAELTKKSLVSRIPPLGRASTSELKTSTGSVSTSNSALTSATEAKIASLFSRYKDPSEEAILSQGIEAFCLDLELKPEEFKVLLFAWKCNVEVMCRFSRSEFHSGCRSLKAESLRTLQLRLVDAVNEVMSNKEQFKDLYRFTYRFGLEPGQKVLPIDMAVSLWQLVFSQREPPLLGRWLRFLLEHPEIRGIPRDTWNMFLSLTDHIGDNLSLYDDSEAWPSLFDDFVEHENDKANQNLPPKSVDESHFIRTDPRQGNQTDFCYPKSFAIGQEDCTVEAASAVRQANEKQWRLQAIRDQSGK